MLTAKRSLISNFNHSFLSSSENSLSTNAALSKQHFKLVIVGGGSGGAASSNIFGGRWGRDSVAIVEPQKPGWTLVGGGLKSLEQTKRSMNDILSKKVTRIKDKVTLFEPHKNLLTTSNGTQRIFNINQIVMIATKQLAFQLEYDFLIVAVGIQPRFDLIKGLPEAFGTPGVCSNYDSNYVESTYETIRNYKGGNAIFTFPSGVIKCPGAPQKIAYIADAHFRQAGIRQKTHIAYNTALGVIFGSPKYAAELTKVAAKREIAVNFRHNLIEVKPNSKEAIFDIFNAEGKVIDKKTFKYDMLHVGPPCKPPIELSSNSELVDSAGFVNVNRETLQHTKFSNIFALGDCTNVPVPRTAAAIASQIGVLRKNLTAAMDGKDINAKYNGYTSCPLLTSTNRLILAEFSGFTGEPMETFPVDQGKERYSGYFLKRYLLPIFYWNWFIKGWWEGPAGLRKFLRFGRN